jgi:hypothetical protein
MAVQICISLKKMAAEHNSGHRLEEKLKKICVSQECFFRQLAP